MKLYNGNMDVNFSPTYFIPIENMSTLGADSTLRVITTTTASPRVNKKHTTRKKYGWTHSKCSHESSSLCTKS